MHDCRLKDVGLRGLCAMLRHFAGQAAGLLHVDLAVQRIPQSIRGVPAGPFCRVALQYPGVLMLRPSPEHPMSPECPPQGLPQSVCGVP